MSQPVASSTAEPINADTKNIAGVLRSENRAGDYGEHDGPPCRRWGRTVPTRGPDGFVAPEDDGVKSRLDCEPCDGGDDEQPEQKLHVEGMEGFDPAVRCGCFHGAPCRGGGLELYAVHDVVDGGGVAYTEIS